MTLTMPLTLAPGTPLPAYAHNDDAGMDLTAHIEAPLTLTPGEMSPLFGTGVACALPSGYFGLLVPRSSLGKKGLVFANTVGIIDNGYRGEIKVRLVNISSTPQTVDPGERVVQLVLLPYVQAQLIPVETLPETARGEGGFGSTGK